MVVSETYKQISIEDLGISNRGLQFDRLNQREIWVNKGGIDWSVNLLEAHVSNLEVGRRVEGWKIYYSSVPAQEISYRNYDTSEEAALMLNSNDWFSIKAVSSGVVEVYFPKMTSGDRESKAKLAAALKGYSDACEMNLRIPSEERWKPRRVQEPKSGNEESYMTFYASDVSSATVNDIWE